MSMTLDAGDEWAPGEAATLTIVDGDANKMSTSAETLDVNDEAQSIPTITWVVHTIVTTMVRSLFQILQQTQQITFQLTV